MKHSKKKKRTGIEIGIGILILVLLVGAVYASANIANNTNTNNIQGNQGNLAAKKIIPEKGVLSNPEKTKIDYLTNLTPVNITEQQRREGNVAKVHKKGPKLNQTALPIGPKNGTETNIVSKIKQNPFQVFTNDPVGNAGIPSGFKSLVHEPSEAQSNDFQNIFWTANWYAARSTNGGNSFSYVNAFADFPTFCCDQDVVYDSARGMFLWYRQGISNSNGVNYFRLGISNDNGNSWVFYNVFPTTINGAWTNQWWDYPQLATDNNFLYIATNIFDVNGFWTRTVMLQFPLDQLHQQGQVNFQYLPWTSNFNFGLAQEVPNSGTNEIFFASHNTNSNIRVFKWDEIANTITFFDRDIDAWTSGVLHQCPGPDGTDSCQRSDERLTGGWHNSGLVGFFWNVAQGNGFNYPYIDSAQFDDVNIAYGCGGSCNARPFVWNSGTGWQYGSAAPDISGHLGVDFFLGGGSNNPSHYVGIWDEFTPAPPGWTILNTNTGTNGPSGNIWGDYLRARATSIDHLWSGSAYILQGGKNGNNVDPRYVLFGRNSPPGNNLVKQMTLVKGSDNALWYRLFDGNQWGNWISLGGILSSDPDSVSYSSGHVVVVVRGSDNGLWIRTWDGSTWSNWASQGGILSSGPSISSPSINKYDVFVRGSDNALWYKTFDGNTWSNWNSLGGILSSDPDASNRLDIVVRGSDNALWIRPYNTNTNTWDNWISLGGILVGGPSVTSYNSVEYVFARGSDNALWYRLNNGNWGNWISLGGIISADPDATSIGNPIYLSVFVRGSDNGLYYRKFDGASWSNWISLGGTLNGGPTGATWT